MKHIVDRYGGTLWTCASILLGNAVLAFAIAAFVMPHGILMGGATGVGILLNHFLNIDVAVLVLILNLAALLLGWIVLGKTFVVATVGSSLLYPILLSLMQRIPGITLLTDRDGDAGADLQGWKSLCANQLVGPGTEIPSAAASSGTESVSGNSS